MVRVWFLGNIKDDQRLENHREPPQFININQLRELTGAEYFYVDVTDYKNNTELKKILNDRGITYADEITCSKECLPNYDEKLKIFFEEHLHTDEEIRFVLDGSGYFDLRTKQDEWLRVEVVTGDLLIVPAGIYHRFTLDANNYIKAKRYFAGEPVWTPYNRDNSSEEMQCRKMYLKQMNVTQVDNKTIS